MIKKIILASLSLVFALIVLGLSLFRSTAQTADLEIVPASSGRVLGVEKTVNKEEVATESGEEGIDVLESETTSEAVAVSDEPEKLDYNLPYPGILPDHPLYFLKMIRDRIELFFTTGSLKRGEKLLHFADKRIGAAKALVEKEKVKLGLTTALKAEKYLQRAVSQGDQVKEKEKEPLPFLHKLEKAARKHEEIILEMKDKIEGQGETIEQLLTYPRQAQEQAKQLLD